MTLEIAVASLLLAVLLGLIVALIKLSRRPYLGKIVTLYTGLIRGVPSLIMIYLVYYGFQSLLNDFLYQIGLRDIFIIDSFVAGVVTIGFIYGAYLGETFRGAILAIDPRDIEAAQAFGFSPTQLFWRIKFPQMIRHGLSSFENNWLVLLKDTSIISIIGISDMVYFAKKIGISIGQPFNLLFLVSLIYLLFHSVSSYGLQKIKSIYHLE